MSLQLLRAMRGAAIPMVAAQAAVRYRPGIRVRRAMVIRAAGITEMAAATATPIHPRHLRLRQ